jgi:hypothetical protein
MKNLKFTDLEKKVLRSYLPSELNLDCMSDCCISLVELCSRIFTNESEFIHLNILKGALGSLSKKNILTCDDYDSNGFNLIFLSENFNWNQESFNKIVSLTK